MTKPNPRRAIGFIREDLAGRHASWDCRDITLYAAEHGLALVKILQIPPNVFDPTLRLLNNLSDHSADIVITPSQVHVAGLARRAITEKWELHVIESSDIFLCGHKWPTSIRLERP